MSEAAPLTIFLYSFSFKYSGPPVDESGHGGGFVFDCRALPNPFWDESIRSFHGGEPPIITFMERHPAVAEFANHAAWLVGHTAETYGDRGYTRLQVAFGCTGGRHRSVYQAERMREALERGGHRVVLEHLDIHRVPAGAGK